MEYRKLTELRKLPNNPRTIKDESFKSLCKSIQDNPDYFEARPCILSDRTGELVIIAGNQRFDAAAHLKLKEIPTHLLTGLTEEREREIIIRDNVANGEWDVTALAEWDKVKLEEWGVVTPWSGLDINTDFTDKDVNLQEEFDPFGTEKNVQRVVFIFATPEDAETYLSKNEIEFKKMNMAWQVNMNIQSI